MGAHTPPLAGPQAFAIGSLHARTAPQSGTSTNQSHHFACTGGPRWTHTRFTQAMALHQSRTPIKPRRPGDPDPLRPNPPGTTAGCCRSGDDPPLPVPATPRKPARTGVPAQPCRMPVSGCTGHMPSRQRLDGGGGYRVNRPQNDCGLHPSLPPPVTGEGGQAQPQHALGSAFPSPAPRPAAPHQSNTSASPIGQPGLGIGTAWGSLACTLDWTLPSPPCKGQGQAQPQSTSQVPVTPYTQTWAFPQLTKTRLSTFFRPPYI